MNTPFRSPYMTPQLGDDWRRQEWQAMVGRLPALPQAETAQPSAFPAQAPAGGGGDSRLGRWNEGNQFVKNLTGYDVNGELAGMARDIGGDWAGDLTGAYLGGGRKAAALQLGKSALGAMGIGAGAGAASGAAGAGAGAAGAGGLGGAMSALGAAL